MPPITCVHLWTTVVFRRVAESLQRVREQVEFRDIFTELRYASNELRTCVAFAGSV